MIVTKDNFEQMLCLSHDKTIQWYKNNKKVKHYNNPYDYTSGLMVDIEYDTPTIIQTGNNLFADIDAFPLYNSENVTVGYGKYENEMLHTQFYQGCFPSSMVFDVFKDYVRQPIIQSEEQLSSFLHLLRGTCGINFENFHLYVNDINVGRLYHNVTFNLTRWKLIDKFPIQFEIVRQPETNFSFDDHQN